jgi:transposase
VVDREAADPAVEGAAAGWRDPDTPDETLFAAIVHVLVSGCAWRALPPCFGISKSTAHRRFVMWSRAGVWGRLYEAVLHRLDDAGLVDVSRVVLDTAHVRAKKGANTQV